MRPLCVPQVRTPHRFELMLSEPLVIGMRRAAQRMMGGVLTKLKGRETVPSDGELKAMLVDELAALAK